MWQQFGSYRLLERLGGGGMAEVWKAEIVWAGGVTKTVALKRIREDLLSQAQIQSLFLDEAKLSSRISHANVAQVIDFGVVDGCPFLAMEHVHGADLDTLLRRARERGRRLPLDVAAFVMAEICRGLAAAHGLRDDEGKALLVVHRDVSPQNVLLSWAGEVKLIDFGIARARDKVTQTEAGVVMGKFRYMSPEQVSGAAVDARSDIFSAGVILHELVTGEHLFDAASSAAMVDQIRFKPLVPLSTLRPEVDPALDRLAGWALERDLARRCPDAARLAQDLERYLHVAHPHFTRDAVADLLRSVLGTPDEDDGSCRTLAFAGTELAPAELRPTAPARPLAPAVTAQARPRAAAEPAATPVDPAVDGVPAETMDPGAPSARARVDGSAGVPAHDTTMTLARRPTRESTPVRLPDPPTMALAPDRATGGATAATRVAEGGPAPGALAATRTRLPSTPPRDEPTARRARAASGSHHRVEAVLALVLGALLAGVAGLLWLRSQRADRTPAPPSPAATTRSDAGNLRADAGTDAAEGSGPPVSLDAARVEELRRRIAAAWPGSALAAARPTAGAAALLEHAGLRLQLATVDERGTRRLGEVPSRSGPGLGAAATDLADPIAELVLLSGALPDPLRRLVDGWEPPAATQDGTAPADPVAALRAVAHPDSAPRLLDLMRENRRSGRWRAAPPAGARFVYPHLVLPADAVARLTALAPKHASLAALRAWLERPAPGPVRVGLLEVERLAVHLATDRRALHVTLKLGNRDAITPWMAEKRTFRLRGSSPEPVLPGDLRGVGETTRFERPLAPDQEVRVALTFPWPAGARADALLLEIQVGAVQQSLRLRSDLLP
jgi:tRNA A-37 threonylcarbamoyl transferase component Bud32